MVESLLTTMDIIQHFCVCYIRYKEKFFICLPIFFEYTLQRLTKIIAGQKSPADPLRACNAPRPPAPSANYTISKLPDISL